MTFSNVFPALFGVGLVLQVLDGVLAVEHFFAKIFEDVSEELFSGDVVFVPLGYLMNKGPDTFCLLIDDLHQFDQLHRVTLTAASYCFLTNSIKSLTISIFCSSEPLQVTFSFALSLSQLTTMSRVTRLFSVT